MEEQSSVSWALISSSSLDLTTRAQDRLRAASPALIRTKISTLRNSWSSGSGSLTSTSSSPIDVVLLICIFVATRMAGIPEDDEMLPSCVEDVRASIDLDGDGDITKEEFVKNALKNDFISKLLKYENSCQ